MKEHTKKIKQDLKSIKEDARHKVAAATGKKPSDVVIKVEKARNLDTNSGLIKGLSKLSQKAGGKKARRTTTKYNPGDDDYDKVEEMVTIGLDQHTIAKIMGVSIATLIKYYRHTLDTGREKRTARVAGVAYEMAVSGDSAAMTTFWLKTQGGWTPKQHIVHEDRNFDVSWSDSEEDIADANNRTLNLEDKVH